uniref:tRNA uridine 5-carboxymethylaminomethyl modification enzyme C-terminal subdomain domain-containing protein n=1 Tax=Meloidogyne enterolobii TaxID=390850 RepID=A0A6V7TU88_MELEN|nr:unnamed protein product [Meloidogyne enterolobii]
MFVNTIATRKYLLYNWHQRFIFVNYFCVNSKKLEYDVVIVGGGHAGCEAAAAASRKGAKSLLITQSKATVGAMSCNPSFGGIGKGHLMREIDAMDGICARLCDDTGIHFHVLNRSHGPAVIGLRALIDRKLYKKAMQKEIFENTPNLDVIESTVEDLIIVEATCSTKNNFTHKLVGCIIKNGINIYSPSIIITTGTFLKGELNWGGKSVPGGRMGEGPSSGLAETFARLGFKTGRLSTGTPPRLLSSTINYDKFTKQATDEEPIPFSFLNSKVGIPTELQLASYVGYTNDNLVKIVRENIDEKHSLISALNEGIKGPRYCPSLEAKCLRFPELKHRIFLEPEGLDSELVYPQGCALGFDLDVQVKIMRTVEGLENVEVTQPGYSVRYNFVHPQQLFPTLETQKVCGLFLAGQINGTTGYEEAAAQGLIAGTNAAERAEANKKGDKTAYNPLKVSRTEAYIGVMIDDLTNFGVTEAYRIFTSRSENRLELRPDNADFRLTEKAYKKGLVSDHRWSHFKQMCSRLEVLDERLDSIRFTSDGWNAKIEGLNTPGKTGLIYSAKKLLVKHPELRLEKLATVWPSLFNEFIGERLLLERIINKQRYLHLNKELRVRIEKLEKEMNTEIPTNLNYLENVEIKAEVRERLNEVKPKTLAAAARISGVTDTVLFTLLRYARNTLNNNNNV